MHAKTLYYFNITAWIYVSQINIPVNSPDKFRYKLLYYMYLCEV